MASNFSTVTLRQYFYPLVLTGVIILWFLSTADKSLLYSLYWPESLTMVLGAFVAGSTPLGGGAVAFPVLTKVLEYSASDARLFSLLIQSVGMSCASVLFIGLARKIYWKAIISALPFSLFMMIGVMPYFSVPDVLAKSVFTLFELVALSILLFSLTRSKQAGRGLQSTSIFCLAVVGGTLCATIGSGADLMIFIYLVVVKQIEPVKAIPTTVVFMALNAICSTLYTTHHYEFPPEVVYAWLAAVPVVAVAAPLGGYVIGLLPSVYVLRFIIGLVLLDLLSTLVISSLPLYVNLAVIGTVISFILLKFNWVSIYRSRVASVPVR